MTLAALCRFKLAAHGDPECRSAATVTEASTALATMRQVMTWAQSRRDYAWAVYNCSQHVYQICRSLISGRHPEIAAEALLWTVVAVESVYTLMSRRHIVWRTRLYVMAAECYHQTRMERQLKRLTERALRKIAECRELEAAHGLAPSDGDDDGGPFDAAAALVRPLQFRSAVWTTTKPQKRRGASKEPGEVRSPAAQAILELLEALFPDESGRLPAVCQVFQVRRTMHHCPLQQSEMPLRFRSDRNALNHRRHQTKNIIVAGATHTSNCSSEKASRANS